MKKFNKIGILTSGGDAPGMNAVVRAVARRAAELGVPLVCLGSLYTYIDIIDLV